jgi:hypothetical protein
MIDDSLKIDDDVDLEIGGSSAQPLCCCCSLLFIFAFCFDLLVSDSPFYRAKC